jgi:undecaprenyl diphosphate synthase
VLFGKKRKQTAAMSAIPHAIGVNDLDPTRIPAHIAIVMDGNGRWAKARHLPRVMGHKEGVNTLRDICRAASNLGVQVLTVFAFSSENWKRPAEEVNFLMDLVVEALQRDFLQMMENQLILHTCGDLKALPQRTRLAIEQAKEKMAHNTGMILNVAINYGGRWELAEACRKIGEEVRQGLLEPAQIDEHSIARHLTTAGLPDPDLFIRTSGEERISNFLLWQLAYSELYFTDVKWPDFQPDNLYQAIYAYQNRDRRFGGIKPDGRETL